MKQVQDSSETCKAHPWGRGYLPSLDGWRAISVLIVLGSHSKDVVNFPPELETAFWWLFDGNLGVRCFFLISGFLITTLMLRETAERGKLDLKRFYLRRSVRILPVYGAFLIGVALLQYLTVFYQSSLQWLHLLTFTTDFSLVGNWLTGHTWSLACEEQFYLVWPVLFVVLNLHFIRTKILLLCLPLAICPLWRVLSYMKIFPENGLFSAFSIFCYLDTLAIGCLLAYVHPWLGSRFSRLNSFGVVAASSALVIGPYIMQKALILGFLTVPLGNLSQAVGLSLLISLSIHAPRSRGGRILNLKPVMWVGSISYSLYIWQQFFCANPQIFGWHSTWFQSFPIWVIPAMVTACVSYYGLERPLLALRKRLHTPRPSTVEPASDKVRLPDVG